MQIRSWKARTWCQWVSSGLLGLLEGYGGQFEVAEHGRKAVYIDSSSYICVMCMQCHGTIQWPLGCMWLCRGAVLSVCLSVYKCICVMLKFVEVVGTQNAKIRA